MQDVIGLLERMLEFYLEGPTSSFFLFSLCYLDIRGSLTCFSSLKINFFRSGGSCLIQAIVACKAKLLFKVGDLQSFYFKLPICNTLLRKEAPASNRDK